MNIQPASRSKKAFTIVEVLMSLSIIAISAAGLMGCFSYAFMSIRMARENQRATQIILERAEAIRCFPWDRLNEVPTADTNYYNPATLSKPIYNVYTTISAFSASPAPSYADNMRELKIVVQWTTGSISRSRTNVTYIAKDGIQNYVF